MIDQNRRPDRPEPGYYATRLVKNGPEVACRIIEVDGMWVVLVNMEPSQEAAEREPWRCRSMERVAFSRRVTVEEYDRLLTAAAEAKPGEPLADPTKPVRWRDAPPLY